METKSMKVAIVGHSGVGKTSIINRYIFDSFDCKLEATTGAVFRQKKHQLADKTEVSLKIWDTAGQQRYRSIAKIYYNDAKVVLAVYDVTDQRSFQQLKLWVSQVRNNAPKDARLIVVGNKIDLMHEKNLDRKEVSYQTAYEYCKSIGVQLKLTSANNSKGIMQLFNTVAQKGSLSADQVHRDEEQKLVSSNHTQLQVCKSKSGCCF